MAALCLILLFMLLVVGSLRLRVNKLRQEKFAADTRSSPLSIALTDLVATAGGVYLSLIMLTSFLKVNVPDELFLWGISFDPLAFLSLVITLVQPLFSLFFYQQ